MKLVKFSVPRNIYNLYREVDRNFGWPFNSRFEVLNTPNTDWSPRVNVAETDDEFIIDAELPGIKQEDVKITFRENTLTIKGERKREEEYKDENYRRFERRYGTFQRSFTIPSFIKNDKIKADFKEGVLKISLPKAEEAKPKEIEISLN